MNLTRIYLPSSQIREEIEVKDKKIVNKIKNVLRLSKEDKLLVFDGEGKEYLFEIIQIKKDYLKIKKIALRRKIPSSLIKIFLAFPLFRKERIEFILEKATELGVDKFLPFVSQRTIMHTPPSSLYYERWRRIIIEAARQSNRVWIPSLEKTQYLEEIIKENKYDKKIVASLQGEYNIKITKEDKNILLIVGPEGDFSEEEYKLLKEANFSFLKLSSYTLRVETAAIFLVGLIRYFIDGGKS